MKLFSRKEFIELLEWVFVLYVAFYMSVYGAAKYIQFGNINQYTQPLNSYQGMQLMWAFYAYSKAFAVNIGIFEILGSVLLILPKTRILGGFILTSILVNIILQDTFYGVHIGALAGAALYQILILIIFYWHRNQILQAFSNLKLTNALILKNNFLKYVITGILIFIGLYYIPVIIVSIINFFNI